MSISGNCHPLESDAVEKLSSSPFLDYGCTPWRISSQRVADLYDSGTKLWTKDNLVDIERQLEQSATLDKFTVKTLDGKQVHVKNPGYGARKLIW